MAYPTPKHSPRFVDLARHRRSDKVMQIKQKMARTASDYGGRFTSYLVLNEPGRPRIYDQWFDFLFPGADKFTLWNASIVTAQKAYWERVAATAYAQATAMLSKRERAENVELEFVPASWSSTGKVLGYKLVEREETRFKQFNGLTFSEQLRKLESKIAKDEPPLIHECFEIDRSYAYGIGLHIVLQADFINQAAIESAIDRFLAIGEMNWVSPKPVALESLLKISEWDALDEHHKAMSAQKNS